MIFTLLNVHPVTRYLLSGENLTPVIVPISDSK